MCKDTYLDENIDNFCEKKCVIYEGGDYLVFIWRHCAHVHGHGNERRQAKSFKLTKLFCGEGDSEAATISVGACADWTKHWINFVFSSEAIKILLVHFCYVNKETKWQLATTEFGPKAPPFLLLWLETAGTLSTKMHERLSIVMPKDCHQGAAPPGCFRHRSE